MLRKRKSVTRLGAALVSAFALVLGLWVAYPQSVQASETAFSDDFSGGAGSWTTHGGSWNVISGPAYQQSVGDRNARAFAGDSDWTDAVVEASVRPQSGTGSSFSALLGRVQGDESYYYLALRNNGTFEINKLVDGSRTELASTAFGVRHGSDYDLRLEMTGNRITGSVNGQELLTATDGEFGSGRIGLKTFNATADFRAVSVQLPGGGGADPSDPGDGDDPGSVDPPTGDSPLGYAAMNGGTTGGFGGSPVNVYRLSEFSNPADAMYDLLYEHIRKPGEGLVIYVDTKVSEATFSRSKFDVKDVSHVSVLGTGNGGEIEGIGFTVSRADNIVFRNLEIHHVRQGEGTAIEVTNNSHNVWIDHNEFYSERENAPNKDYYDGLVDIKRNAEYVTVSWNYFHDHWKTMLLGHTDNESLKPDRVTYHHNWFRNVNSRIPLIRYADVHMMNNLFQDVTGSAVNARMGARVMVEGNYFLNVGSGETDTHAGYPEGPVGWFYGSSQTGYWNLQNNTYQNSPHEHLSSTTSFTPPYSYQVDSPEVARSRVEQYSGVGVIDINP
ncbi:hypothetical protein PJ985_13015 [Streptomyces sp. ACA25]|uniref:pectate lyase family protein n=1 Tax=Streptomyces sp. ACA25 TaxID=3022596 RepID=UPI002307571F|nr:hypothetical protein [Streptomyces sp. ACA25]MDB1088487.1 hypothetical protein [Streptomyces sp. ACA25]